MLKSKNPRTFIDPKPSPKADHDDLFRARLGQIINMRHALPRLAERIHWAWIEE